MRAPAQLQGTRDFLLGLGRAIISDRFFHLARKRDPL